MKNKIIRLYVGGLIKLLAAGTAVMTGCTRELHEKVPEPVYVGFEFSPARDFGTRSSLGFDENAVSCINVYVYGDGVLQGALYSDDMSSGCGLELQGNRDYNVYALANTGRVEAPADETALSSMVWNAGALDNIADTGAPMMARTTVHTGSMTQTVRLELVRLLSRVNFRLERGALSGLEVTSVRLRQSPLDVMPFAEASAASSVTDGDSASEADLAAVNTGDMISFYMLENCQGVLLPDNDDQWQKVPDNIPEHAGLCTYLEVGGRFDGSEGLSGTVTYRFFLGQDNTSDFNVCRNTESTVILSLTEAGLSRISWRVDNSDVTSEGLEYILDAPEYAGEWGTVVFPEATAEDPVTVEWDGETLQIPSPTAAHIGDPDYDAPNLMVYVPQTGNTLHFCFGTRIKSYTDFTVVSGIRRQTISVSLRPYPKWSLYIDDGEQDFIDEGGTAKVSEDGYALQCWFYLRDSETDELVHNTVFYMPEQVRAYLDGFRKCPDRNSHVYWYYDIDAYISDSDKARIEIDWSQKPALDSYNESYFFVGNLYGIAADGDSSSWTTMRCVQNYLSGATDYDVEVIPAFPGQRHLGAVYNYSMALGNLQNDRSVIAIDPMTSSRATWKIGWGKRYEEGDSGLNDGAVFDIADGSLVSVSAGSGSMVIKYGEPERFSDIADIAGGTYHIRGTVTNPKTGRKISGDYSVDIICYLVAGADVRFYRGDGYDLPSGTYMDFSYVPVMERYGNTDDESYHDICATLPVCDIYNGTRGRKFGLGDAFLYERKVDGIRLPDLDNLDKEFGYITSQLQGYLSDAGREFCFVDPVTGENLEMLKYHNETVTGRFFYEIHRLQDVEPGVYFIEEYYGSLDNY